MSLPAAAAWDLATALMYHVTLGRYGYMYVRYGCMDVLYVSTRPATRIIDVVVCTSQRADDDDDDDDKLMTVM